MANPPRKLWIPVSIALAAAVICLGAWIILRAIVPAAESPNPLAAISKPESRTVVKGGPDELVAIDRRLLSSVRFLASDELEGRGVGTKGLDLAANYIADQFRSLGLRTDVCDGSPFQIVMRTSKLGLTGTDKLALVGPRSRRQLVLKTDFQPLSLSVAGEFDLPVAFVGHGITVGEQRYDDYADVDVVGKAVILLRNMPRHEPVVSRSRNEELSSHAYVSRKVANAIAHGAAAVILCTNREELLSPETRGSAARSLNSESQDRFSSRDALLGFNVSGGGRSRRIPVVHVRRAVIDDMLLEARDTNLLALEEAIDRDRLPHSFILTGWTIRGRCTIGRVTSELKNVVAALEGEGESRDEIVVVGAHYDHLGYGGGWGSLAPWTREIHNGADDNASGTAVMIEVARQLVSQKTPMQRRVLFVGFTAEESGLIGSEYFVRHSPMPVSQQVAMVNLDMVGYLRDHRLTISGTGTASGFPSLVDELAAKHQLHVLTDPSGYGPSDHASFHSQGIPVLHLFTGFHENYHRPSDDAEKLNIAGMRRIAEFTAAVVARLANAPQRPGLPSSQPSVRASVASNLRSFNLSGLGIEGDPSFTGNGLRVRRIIKRSPADRVGVRIGDVVAKINDASVASIDDFETAAAKLRIDSPVRITVHRSSVVYEFQVR